MKDSRQYRVYRQKFNSACITAHGTWSKKESIILRKVSSKGRVSYGEVSIVKGFTNENLNELLPIVKYWSLGGDYINNNLVCSALSCLESLIWHDLPNNNAIEKIKTAELINNNSKISGKGTFKIKIGVKDLEDEITEITNLLKVISLDSTIRLDANESLGVNELYAWNEALKDEKRVEFLEQPFTRESIDKLFKIQHNIKIPLALDESLYWKNDFSYFEKKNWEGFYIIKPSLTYDWGNLINFIKLHREHCIISTVFESPFGYEAVVRCARYSKRVAGLDRNLFFNCKGEFPAHHKKYLTPGSVSVDELDKLWSRL